ncbi:MAG: stage II sporulation protein M [Planctomycetes bacterium]|nr:stage II sporulation protein M [Planctomycetota bacterium]MCB9905808.1 stage II sporulation protein M [Planctomycetota bacterium]
MTAARQDPKLLERLHKLSQKARRKPRRLSDAELEDLPRLYRAAASISSRLVTRGDQPAAIRESKRVLAQAHAQLHAGLRSDDTPWYRRMLTLVFLEGPRSIRAEWRIVGFWMLLFYGLGALGYVLVANDLGMAFRLVPPAQVADAISQLDGLAPGEAWEGNFTFGLDASSSAAGMIMGHNLWVCVLWMISGVMPPLMAFFFANFALMIGAYVGIASHWGQDASIFSILMCHGTFELTAAILSGSAGTVIARGIVAPGRFSRSYAIRHAGQRALRLFAPTIPLLVAAGLIEGYVSPHAPTSVRLAFAGTSAVIMLIWFGWVGREPVEPQPAG